jgi:hypothetical protein
MLCKEWAVAEQRPERNAICCSALAVTGGLWGDRRGAAGLDTHASRRLRETHATPARPGGMPGIGRLAFLAVLLVALALVPAGAHLLALPNKLAMGREAYLAAQGAYAGWAYLGVLPISAILTCLALALRLQRPPASPWPALLAALLLLAGLAVSFAWTFPANQATANWTMLPEGWEALRAQWEWSHAVNAVLTLAALCAALQAALSLPPAPERRSR